MSDPETGKLASVLSERDSLVLAFGAMIGWGWIILSGEWIFQGGPLGAILAFLLGGVIVAIVAVVYGELAAAMPFAGGEHVYSLRALGPLGSFICTWAIIFGYVAVAAFEAVALPSAVAFLVPGFNLLEVWQIAGEPVYATWILVGALGAVGMTSLNYLGIRPAAQFQAVMTVVIGLIGLILVAGAITNGQPSGDPPLAAGVGGIFAVTLMTPFMFVGFDVIPQSAEEINFASGSLGRLILGSVVLAALFYIAVIWGASRALPGAQLVDSPLPAVTAMATLFESRAIGQIMAIAGIAGILTSWNAFIIGGSRAIYAMADSGMLPRFLSKVHPEYNTPSNAILLIGVLSVLAPFFGEQMLTWIVNAGGFGIVIAWFFVAVSFLVLRYREPEMDRPYQVPFGAVVGVAALALTAFLIFLYLPGGPSELVWPFEWLLVGAWTGLGLVFFSVSPAAEDVPYLGRYTPSLWR